MNEKELNTLVTILEHYKNKSLAITDNKFKYVLEYELDKNLPQLISKIENTKCDLCSSCSYFEYDNDNIKICNSLYSKFFNHECPTGWYLNEICKGYSNNN